MTEAFQVEFVITERDIVLADDADRMARIRMKYAKRELAEKIIDAAMLFERPVAVHSSLTTWDEPMLGRRFRLSCVVRDFPTFELPMTYAVSYAPPDMEFKDVWLIVVEWFQSRLHRVIRNIRGYFAR